MSKVTAKRCTVFYFIVMAVIAMIAIRLLVYSERGGSWNFISVDPAAEVDGDNLLLHIQRKGFRALKNNLSHGGIARELILSKLVKFTFKIQKDGSVQFANKNNVYEKSTELIELDYQSVKAARIRQTLPEICSDCAIELLDISGERALYRAVDPYDSLPNGGKFVEFDRSKGRLICEFSERSLLLKIRELYNLTEEQSLDHIFKELRLSLNNGDNGYFVMNSIDEFSSGHDFLTIKGCNDELAVKRIKIGESWLQYGPVISYEMEDVGYIYASERNVAASSWAGVINLSDNTVFKFPTYSSSRLLDVDGKRVIFYDLIEGETIKFWVVDLTTRMIKESSVKINVDYIDIRYRIWDQLPTVLFLFPLYEW